MQQEKERGRKSVAASDAEQNQAMAASSTTMGVPPPANHPSTFTSAVSMIAPLPGQAFPQPQTAPQSYGYPPPGFQYAPPVSPAVPQERWDNMATLFQSVRQHARVFEYPAASVAALEAIVIRLYLESPMGITQNVAPMPQNGIRQPAPPTHMHTPTPNQQSNMNGSVDDEDSTSNAEDTS